MAGAAVAVSVMCCTFIVGWLLSRWCVAAGVTVIDVVAVVLDSVLVAAAFVC